MFKDWNDLMKKSSKKKKYIFQKIFSSILLIVSVIFIIILSQSNMLPIKYYSSIIITIFIFDLINIFLINIKKLKRKFKTFVTVVCSIVIVIMSLCGFYIYKTTDVLKNNGDTKYKIENYSVIVLKSENFNKISDVKSIGYYENSIGSSKAIKILNKKQDFEYESYKTSDTLIESLYNKDVNAILVEDSIKNLINEENTSFNEKTKVIYTFKVKIKTKSTTKDANVTKEPFAVYISGIDTYGEIASVSRSDVNIVAIVNPKIKQVLLISIPRDYYVKLHGTSGYKDKLTHAGIYGIDMSIKTIEDLLDIDINYYVKVNFTSVIDIVDALGGLDVYSEYTFTSYSGYNFKKGMNKVNGEQALDFARTRKAFSNGDRQRGINQQAIIEAMVRKASNKSIITKYSSLLNSINGKYQTNMEYKKMTDLIKMQLNDMAKWNITSYSLEGSDSSNYTYTYSQMLYVMEPNENSILEAKNLINKIINDETLENSYTEIGGDSYKVSERKVNTNYNTQQKTETPIPKEDTSTSDNKKNTIEKTNKTNDEEVLETITPKEEEDTQNTQDDKNINDKDIDDNNIDDENNDEKIEE